ncbi:MAG: hypothetical protein JSS89_11280 [Bacteroidetes bacterium]|nr:hypothetical protein [Bacteroidota bacterium]
MEHRERTLLPLLTLSLLVSATLGVLMRATPFLSIPLSFDHLRHAHSHWGFLGWVFASFALIVPSAFGIERLQRSWYRMLWIASQTVALVAVTFLVTQGYAGPAIVALAVHGLLTSTMLAAIIMSLPGNMSGRTLQIASLAAIVSTLAPLLTSTLPRLMPWFTGLDGIDGVRFYMSVQIEGFFLIGVMGLLLRMIEVGSGRISPWLFVPALLSMIGALFVTSDLLAAALRAASIAFIVVIVIRTMPQLLHVLSGTSTMVIMVVLGALIVRSLAALGIALLAYAGHDVSTPALRILLFHVVFLGIITPVIFVSVRVWFGMRIARMTWIVYTIGVTGTLLVLLTQSIGLDLPYTEEALLAFAVVIAGATLMTVPAAMRHFVRH